MNDDTPYLRSSQLCNHRGDVASFQGQLLHGTGQLAGCGEWPRELLARALTDPEKEVLRQQAVAREILLRRTIEPKLDLPDGWEIFASVRPFDDSGPNLQELSAFPCAASLNMIDTRGAEPAAVSIWIFRTDEGPAGEVVRLGDHYDAKRFRSFGRELSQLRREWFRLFVVFSNPNLPLPVEDESHTLGVALLLRALGLNEARGELNREFIRELAAKWIVTGSVDKTGRVTGVFGWEEKSQFVVAKSGPTRREIYPRANEADVRKLTLSGDREFASTVDEAEGLITGKQIESPISGSHDRSLRPWAIAAALVLGVGFLINRFDTALENPDDDLSALKTNQTPSGAPTPELSDPSEFVRDVTDPGWRERRSGENAESGFINDLAAADWTQSEPLWLDVEAFADAGTGKPGRVSLLLANQVLEAISYDRRFKLVVDRAKAGAELRGFYQDQPEGYRISIRATQTKSSLFKVVSWLISYRDVHGSITSAQWEIERRDNAAIDTSVHQAGTSNLNEIVQSDAATPDEIKVSIQTKDGDSVFETWDRMQFMVRAEEDCYIAVFLHDSAGNSLMLFPNRETRAADGDRAVNFFVGGSEIEIPGAHSDVFQIRAAPPYGSDVVHVLASSDRAFLQDWVEDELRALTPDKPRVEKTRGAIIEVVRRSLLEKPAGVRFGRAKTVVVTRQKG